jgi:hypothetical protein
MRVSMVQTGGFTGRRLLATLEGADLAPDLADVVTSLVADPLPPPVPSPGGAGQPRYQLTVQDRGVVRHVVLLESTVPAEVRPLLQELLRRATPQ